MEYFCPHNSSIEEWWVNAVHLMNLYSFADGFYGNIYKTLLCTVLLKLITDFAFLIFDELSWDPR